MTLENIWGVIMNTINLHDFAVSLSFGRKFICFPPWNDFYDFFLSYSSDFIPCLFLTLLIILCFWALHMLFLHSSHSFHENPTYLSRPCSNVSAVYPTMLPIFLLKDSTPSSIVALLYYVVIICLEAFLTLDWDIIHSTQSSACKMSTKR